MYPAFDDIIANLNQNKLSSFPGGVHPEDRKALSANSAIARIPLPDLITVPMRQHVGTEGQCCVEVGDHVLKAQPLTTSQNPFCVPVHAPTSGEVVAIGPHVTAHPSGLTEMCISIRPDGKDTWTTLTPVVNYREMQPQKVVAAICDAGISGMGGAGFPTHIKTASSKEIEFLIINGVECEPYITSDDRLMREHAWQIRQGIDVLEHLLSPKAIIIAIEDNKPEAIEAMKIACQDKAAYRVVAVETKYPAGGEKQLIQVITGREVPRNGLPADVGVLMFNVGTSYAIADAIFNGKPLIERVVTVTGEAVQQPGNFWALIGTPVRHLLDQANYLPKKQRQPQIIMGGPMMGFTLTDSDIPVVKITNCLLVPAKRELPDDDSERPCIRCSDCATACPASLLPQQLYWHAKAKELDKAQEYDLFDCIECGACAYVCPSEIPLVHYYRQAKAEIRTQRDERNKAEKARERFEARKARLEQEKLEREEKHRKAKEARLAAANTPSEKGEAKDKVAAALARAKAKKAALADAEGTTPAKDDKKAQVAAAVERAKAKKAAQAAQNAQTSTQQNEQEAPPTSAEQDKKDKVAAAIARAKAKKAAQQAASDADEKGNADSQAPTAQPQDPLSPEEEKKRRVAAAVAKAKAKKAAQAADSTTDTTKIPEASGEQASDDDVATEYEKSNADSQAPTTQPQDSLSPEEEKKRRVAAAVAKAKAKKAAQAADGNADTTESAEASRKQAGEDADVTENEKTSVEQSSDDAETLSPEEEKKRRIAAAVAKAKAKKAARAQNNNENNEP
ncbi:electron transport complex subunit RsxC [Alteromonas sp. H39]|uniref:electron transport complex subunit RsxC n=1 Tax=Alteromonas sp. H39 TaxID=3389876 RepID=UPI0039E1A792